MLVPTLDLLAQTVKAWHDAGHKGPAVAVCSLQDDPELWDLRVRSTTNPVQLALWHGQGPVTIYATYASLGVLAEAFEGVYGQQLAPVDLAVVDEAHRTSGSMGKAWADIHDQSVIPAYRRLYLTATPRIWEERLNREVAEGVRDPLPREMAASMDDEKVFGPVLYKLSLASAVSRGLLARYQIIVLELKDPIVTPERLMGEERRSEEVRGQRIGALQAALLHTMAQHNLSTCITFHHRTIEAQAYAEGLEHVAAKLHADRPETYPLGSGRTGCAGSTSPNTGGKSSVRSGPRRSGPFSPTAAFWARGSIFEAWIRLLCWTPRGAARHRPGRRPGAPAKARTGQARLPDRARLPPAGRTAGGHVHFRLIQAFGESPRRPAGSR